ncbi:MFS transporter [Streptomyces sp. NPDC101169]|uniref:MFS transporter n=1 Tax=Streptomyces sp. NPDC101169 TaxID=3366121 RepID=UPI003800C1B3
MYRSLLVLSVAMFAIGTDSFVIAGILPDAAHSLDVSVATAGWLITAYAFSYAVLGPVMAALTTRWPRRTLFLVGLGIFVAGNLLTALIPVLGVALVARAVAGRGRGLAGDHRLVHQHSPTAEATPALATERQESTA